MKDDLIETWVHYVIYKNPKDYPGKYVLRRWRIYPDEPTVDKNFEIITENLEVIRDFLANYPDLILSHLPEQDPVIFEVWI